MKKRKFATICYTIVQLFPALSWPTLAQKSYYIRISYSCKKTGLNAVYSLKFLNAPLPTLVNLRLP